MTARRTSMARQWTIGKKLIAIVAAGVGVGYGILIAVQISDFYSQSYDLALKRNTHLTRQIAAQISGGVRWQKPRAIERAYHALTIDADSAMASVAVFDRQGAEMTTYQSDYLAAFDLRRVFETAQDRLSDGNVYVGEFKNHIAILIPVIAGRQQVRVGTLGVAWSLELLQNRTNGELVRQAALGIAIVVCLILIVVGMLHRVVGQPLEAIARATLRLAKGDTNSAVPHLDRQDEIGDLARSLQVFKRNLVTIEQLNTKHATQTRRLAEALERERDYNVLQSGFIAMASHEFRTPLTIIDGAAQGLQRRLGSLEPEQCKERITRIRNAVKRMITLIESVLSSASLESGKYKLQMQRCDLEQIVGEVCRSQQEISPTHRIIARLDALPDQILGDSNMLEQVFSNLLSNAVKYAPDNPRIDVIGRESNGFASISVADEGLGIPAAEQGRLFDRFFRASTSSGIAGTGIGLNLVAQVLELHGGRIEVESEKGKGSVFTVFLPIRTLPDTQLSSFSHAAGSLEAT